jgi:hypothetical protein
LIAVSGLPCLCHCEEKSEVAIAMTKHTDANLPYPPNQIDAATRLDMALPGNTVAGKKELPIVKDDTSLRDSPSRPKTRQSLHGGGACLASNCP